jgi:Surface antigen variable number repeat
MRTLLPYAMLFLIFGPPSNRQTGQELDGTPFKCSQPAAERDILINEAEKNRYTVRRVELIGLTYTRDEVLRRRITILLQEGDLFTRDRLVKSLQNVSKLKMIYPVSASHVVIQLDRTEKAIDMIICFRERRRSPGAQRRNPQRAS